MHTPTRALNTRSLLFILAVGIGLLSFASKSHHETADEDIQTDETVVTPKIDQTPPSFKATALHQISKMWPVQKAQANSPQPLEAPNSNIEPTNIEGMEAHKINDSTSSQFKFPQTAMEELAKRGVDVEKFKDKLRRPSKEWAPDPKTLYVDFDQLVTDCWVVNYYQLPAFLNIDANGYVVNVTLMTADPDGGENAFYGCQFNPVYVNNYPINIITKFIPGKRVY